MGLLASKLAFTGRQRFSLAKHQPHLAQRVGTVVNLDPVVAASTRESHFIPKDFRFAPTADGEVSEKPTFKPMPAAYWTVQSGSCGWRCDEVEPGPADEPVSRERYLCHGQRSFQARVIHVLPDHLGGDLFGIRVHRVDEHVEFFVNNDRWDHQDCRRLRG